VVCQTGPEDQVRPWRSRTASSVSVVALVTTESL